MANTKQELISLLEHAAHNTSELNHCKWALLIGSQAAYLTSSSQRKPLESADWDIIANASYLISWLKGNVRLVEVKFDANPNLHVAEQQDKKQKQNLLSSIKSKFSFLSTDAKEIDNQQSFPPFISVRLTIMSNNNRSYYGKKTLDVEVPFSLQSSAAQILLYESKQNKTDSTPFEHDPQLSVKVASLEILLGLKKTVYHPSKWMRHIEDFHNLAKLNTTEPKTMIPKKLLPVLDMRVKEAEAIHHIHPKPVDAFDCHEFLQETPETQALLNSTWQLDKSQFEKATEKNIQLIAHIIEAYTLQNKLFSPMTSLEILATSKSPAKWWSDYLIENFPQVQEAFLKKIPTVSLQRDSPSSLPSAWMLPQLPLEIVMIVASYLDVTSAYRASKLASVSTSWKSFWTNDLVWKTLFLTRYQNQPVCENLSWKSNFMIRRNLDSYHLNENPMHEMVSLTSKFQQTTTEDLLSFWQQLLKISQPSVAYLRMFLTNIHKLQWMLQHTFIVSASASPAADEDSPSKCKLQFFIGCKDLPNKSNEFILEHLYGERGSSRFSIEAHELRVTCGMKSLRKFDGPTLFGLHYGGWGLSGDLRETSDLSTDISPEFELPEGIMTTYFIHVAECQKHVKSYFTQEWRASSWY